MAPPLLALASREVLYQLNRIILAQRHDYVTVDSNANPLESCELDDVPGNAVVAHVTPPPW